MKQTLTCCVRRGGFLREVMCFKLCILKFIIAIKSRSQTLGQTLIKKLGWKTIDERIASESNIMVFKSLQELVSPYMCNLFTKTSQVSSRNLRNTATDLRLPKKNSKNGQKCFSFRGARSWNGLTAELKQPSSLYSFKQSLFSCK